MGDFCVYKHETPSGKVYIGITKQNPSDRWKGGWGYYTQLSFYRAILKYGWGNIGHDILYTGLDEETACQFEQDLIRKYDSTNPKHGYNLTTGGEHYNHTDASKQRCSEGVKKFFADHPDARLHISELQTGTTQSEESNAKRSATLKQYFIDHPEARGQRGRSFRGKKRSAENVHRMSVNSGRNRPIICVETGAVYRSTAFAAKEVNVAPSAITAVLAGRAKTSRGYHWEYYNATEKVSEEDGN